MAETGLAAVTGGVARPNLPVSDLRHGTLQDHVYRELCELILNGEIAPGQLITIQAIADAFRVSAMPVREALQRLSAARVLTVISGRSIGIPPLSTDRLQDLRRVRLEIEPLAADWATPRITEADLRELARLVRRLVKAAMTGSRKEYVRLNRVFHFTIYAAAGSDALMAIIENLWLQISPYFHLLYGSGFYLKANEQHGRMLEGLRARDAGMVRAGIRNDIESAGEVLAGLLQREDGA